METIHKADQGGRRVYPLMEVPPIYDEIYEIFMEAFMSLPCLYYQQTGETLYELAILSLANHRVSEAVYLIIL